MLEEEGVKMASLALRLVKKRGIEVIEEEGRNADECLIKLAKKEFLIATNDSKLREKLKRMEKKTIFIRSKKRIEIG